MLLELHPDIAAISAKNIRNNEGQFFQTVCFHKKQLFSVVPSSFFFWFFIIIIIIILRNIIIYITIIIIAYRT